MDTGNVDSSQLPAKCFADLLDLCQLPEQVTLIVASYLSGVSSILLTCYSASLVSTNRTGNVDCSQLPARRFQCVVDLLALSTKKTGNVDYSKVRLFLV